MMMKLKEVFKQEQMEKMKKWLKLEKLQMEPNEKKMKDINKRKMS